MCIIFTGNVQTARSLVNTPPPCLIFWKTSTLKHKHWCCCLFFSTCSRIANMPPSIHSCDLCPILMCFVTSSWSQFALFPWWCIVEPCFSQRGLYIMGLIILPRIQAELLKIKLVLVFRMAFFFRSIFRDQQSAYSHFFHESKVKQQQLLCLPIIWLICSKLIPGNIIYPVILCACQAGVALNGLL